MLTGCSQNPISFLDPQGPIAQAQRHHFWLVVFMTMIVVVPVILQTPFIVWRYRYAGKGAYRPHWDKSRWLDAAMWSVPVIVVVILSVVLWRETHRLDPYRPLDSDRAPLEVQVIGFDWKWFFIYPEQGIATMGQLVLPEDRPIAFRLTSASVLQTFFIPALGGQIDVMNRMVTQLHLQADNTGRFPGKNMQYNGSGFHRQRFVTRVVDDPQFDAFVDQAQRQGQKLDRQRFDQLEEQSDSVDFAKTLGLDDYKRGDLLAFSAVPPQLFHAVVDDTSIDWSLLTVPPPRNAAIRHSSDDASPGGKGKRSHQDAPVHDGHDNHDEHDREETTP